MQAETTYEGQTIVADRWEPLRQEGYNEEAIKSIRRGMLEAEYGILYRFRRIDDLYRHWYPGYWYQWIRNHLKVLLLLWLSPPFRKEYRETG